MIGDDTFLFGSLVPDCNAGLSGCLWRRWPLGSTPKRQVEHIEQTVSGIRSECLAKSVWRSIRCCSRPIAVVTAVGGPWGLRKRLTLRSGEGATMGRCDINNIRRCLRIVVFFVVAFACR